MSNMFNVGKLASNLLDSIDSAANKTIHTEDEEELASVIRSKRRGEENHNNGAVAVESSEEVERLHAECLELEKQVESLTDEVKRAWGAYQGIQEKLTAQEAELSEEITALESAKVEENASLTAEVAELKDEVEVSHNRFEFLLEENKKVMKQFEDMKVASATFLAREKALQEELEEAKACSSSNAAVIREQLIAAEAAMETMRTDHASWMLQSHKRQEKLEQSNAELAQSLTDSQRVLIKLKNGDDRLERDQASSKEVEDLRNKVDELTAAHEELTDLYNEQVRQAQAREREMRAAELLWDDERKRYGEVTDKYAADIETYKSEVKKLTEECRENASLGTAISKKNELEEQVKSLSQQLLRKQASVQELLAERSAFKVRVHDLTTRCTKAEEQVSNLMYNDFEGAVGDGGGGGRGLMRRKGSVPSRHSHDNLSRHDLNSEITSDLEKAYGVRTAPAVARAVNTIDAWAQLTGRYLRVYPVLRLGFVFYLVFLHLWAFAVLIYHANALEREAFADPPTREE